jgi:hypothetical protein
LLKNNDVPFENDFLKERYKLDKKVKLEVAKKMGIKIKENKFEQSISEDECYNGRYCKILN